jgi:hypothetical protein
MIALNAGANSRNTHIIVEITIIDAIKVAGAINQGISFTKLTITG